MSLLYKGTLAPAQRHVTSPYLACQLIWLKPLTSRRCCLVYCSESRRTNSKRGWLVITLSDSYNSPLYHNNITHATGRRSVTAHNDNLLWKTRSKSTPPYSYLLNASCSCTFHGIEESCNCSHYKTTVI